MLSRRSLAQGLVGSVIALTLGRAAAGEPSETPRPLFDAVTLGGLRLSNRMVMAPMTRSRAGVTRTPNELMAEYYGQRAGAGLIVSEAVAISPQGYGWVGSPGIYTQAHVAGWRGVTEAVHARGGRIFMQLWHVGRVSHPDFLEGQQPVAPSAIAAAGDIHTPRGRKQFVVPRAMAPQEIAGTVRDYATAAVLAREAGFDGVEIHAANGYLIDQFIQDGSNHRNDRYGGSVGNRLRFLLEVVEAVAHAWSADRTAVRLSPTNSYNDVHDSQPAVTFVHAAKELDRFGLAYLHVVENLEADSPVTRARIAPRMRAAFRSPFILNGGYDSHTGAAALEAGEADLIAYGRSFLANPDLVERFRLGAALNVPDRSTFYSDGAKGYTDYAQLES